MEHSKKAKNAEMEARKQTFLEASLAASEEAITHSNIEGLELPKQKEINDQKLMEKWNRRMRKSAKELKRN